MTGVQTCALPISQVRQLLQRQNLPVTRHNVGTLWKTLLVSAGYLGLAEVGTSELGSMLNGSEGAPLVAAVTQGAIAFYSASLVGKSAQRYLLEGATWDAQGSSTVIEKLLAALSPEMVVYRLAGALGAHPETAAILERPALIQERK